MRRLKDNQLKKFDRECIIGKKWDHIRLLISNNLSSKSFSFLDLGGGNGLFADRILHNYPEAKCFLLDNSDTLLNLNKPHPNKKMVADSAQNLDKIFSGEQFDIIFMHFVLHHFVMDSYRETREMQRSIISNTVSLLSPGGFIGVFECIFNGRFIDGLPGWLIYQLTKNSCISGVIRFAGANTAGCGVCFLSERQVKNDIRDSGCEVVEDTRFQVRNFDNRLYGVIARMVLHVESAYQGYFWIKKR